MLNPQHVAGVQIPYPISRDGRALPSPPVPAAGAVLGSSAALPSHPAPSSAQPVQCSHLFWERDRPHSCPRAKDWPLHQRRLVSQTVIFTGRSQVCRLYTRSTPWKYPRTLQNGSWIWHGKEKIRQPTWSYMEAYAAPEELLETIWILRTNLLSRYLTERDILLLPFKVAEITLLLSTICSPAQHLVQRQVKHVILGHV